MFHENIWISINIQRQLVLQGQHVGWKVNEYTYAMSNQDCFYQFAVMLYLS